MTNTGPDQLTTLVLNADFMPSHVVSARHAFHCTFTGRAKALDKNLQPFNAYADWEEGGEIPDDQPVMRSATKEWPVPTIILAGNKMYKKVRPNSRGKTSLFALVKRYNYTCQITGKRFRKNWRKHFTREHVIPVCQGGPTEDWNMLPTCKEANAKKADTFPYYDVNGVDLIEKIKKPSTNFVLVDEGVMRSEWEYFPQVHIYGKSAV